VYNPRLDRQRFCESCKTWYHESCLGDPVEEQLEANKVSLENLAWKVPLIRGLGGNELERANWHIAGNGRKVLKARKWLEQGGEVDGWEEELGKDFIDEMLSTLWSYYACPACNVPI
jgi:hypothetical protein